VAADARRASEDPAAPNHVRPIPYTKEPTMHFFFWRAVTFYYVPL
jgi:hypothetical protein